MAGSGRLKSNYFMIFPLLVGISLFSGVLALEARANSLAADALAASDLFTLPGITAPGAGNGAGMSSSALTGTMTTYYFPIIQKDIVRVCWDIYVDTTWTAAEGPFQLDCSVYVVKGATLTIEAGTVVQFSQSDDTISIFVEGTLRVEGTEQAPVYFKPVSGTTPGSWGSVLFSYGSSGLLDHTILEYGGKYIQYLPHGILNIYSSNVQVSNSVVKGSGDIGIKIMDSSPLISATQILSNHGTNGGGLLIYNGSPTIQNSIIAGNSTTNGGGLFLGSGEPLIMNNIFYDNSADNGGGLYISGDSPIIRSNIIVSNTANSGGGIYNEIGAPQVDYNDVRNNAGGDYQGLTPGGHDISTDPLLVDLANGDFHLTPGSACIDAGDPANHPAADFEGDPRPMGLAPDIGIDEFRDLGVVKTSTSQDVYPGGPVTYTINVLNNGSITLTNVQLTDSLPLEAAFTSYHADDFTCAHDGAAWGGLLNCTLDSVSLLPGESRVLTLAVALTETIFMHQYVTNQVTLTADAGENTLTAQDYAPTWINWCRVQLNEAPVGDDLQAAINASTHITDVIKVSGYCTQHDLDLNKTLFLQGGWKWDFSEHNPGVYTTTLDAHQLGRVIQVYGNITPTIEDFAITGGYGVEGSGIYIFSGSPTIQNNIFTHNMAWGYGFTLLAVQGNPLIQDNTFTDNNGSGLIIYNGNPLIQNNTFMGNTGHGLRNESGSPTIQNNTFIGNGDSGLYNEYGNPTIQNNTFTGSLSCGLYNNYGSPLIQDNTFSGNSLEGLYNQSGSPTIKNNTFISNTGNGLGNASGSPLIQYNTFTGNHGGGLYSSEGNPTVQNNTFRGNHGYGMWNTLGSPTVQFNLFTGNAGGGFGTSSGSPIIQNNIFMGNGNSTGKGGGVYSWTSTSIIQNNTFMGNIADVGGGIYVLGQAPIIRNNIVVSNTANTGGGIYIEDDLMFPLVDYNDVWNNTGGDYFGIDPGAHNISANPLLVDPAHGDFHLSAGSPCVNAGDPLNFPPTDFEGDVRPNGVAPDIGADEYYAQVR
jgi:uncharacterized repeat protein (TIGR01451 family)